MQNNDLQNFANLDLDNSGYGSDHSTFITATHTLGLGKDVYIVDSGTTQHMVLDKSLIINHQPISSVRVKYGDGSVLVSTLSRTLTLGSMVLNNVLYVPGSIDNLISVSDTEVGKWVFDDHFATLHNKVTWQPIITAHGFNGLYIIKASHAISLSVTAADLSTLTEWHQRLGHLNVRSLLRLVKLGEILGLNTMAMGNHIHGFECRDCVLGKGTKTTFPSCFGEYNSVEFEHGRCEKLQVLKSVLKVGSFKEEVSAIIPTNSTCTCAHRHMGSSICHLNWWIQVLPHLL